MNLGELVLQLGVKADTFTVKDFSRAVGEIPLAAASAVVSLAGLSIGFAELTKDVLEMTSGFKVFTAETGMNSRSLQQWQMVAKQAGLSGDIVTSSLKALTALTAQMNLGYGLPGKAAQALGFFGLGANDLSLNAADMLTRIQSGASGKNASQAAEMLKALGISPEMLRVFETPASVREGMQPLMSQGDINQMAEFQKELATFNQTVLQEFVKVLHDIEPYMADLTEVLTDFVKILGSGAAAVLGDLHSALEARRHGVGLFSGDATPYFKDSGGDKNVTVNHNVTQHIHSTADPMAIADEAARLSRQQHRKAAADLKNAGY